MLSIDEINNTIEELESGTTTFSTCEKLANLYIVRDHYMQAIEKAVEDDSSQQVIKEYSDILPSYSTYVMAKKRYDLGEIKEDSVLKAMHYITKEIIEFIEVLYSSTTMPEERSCLFNMIGDLIEWKDNIKTSSDGIELE